MAGPQVGSMPQRRSNPTRKPALAEGPFRDILLAPDRDRILETWPTVSFHDDDEADYLAPLRERMVGRVDLRRRGVEHGQLAVVDPEGVMPPLPRGKRRRALQRERWVAARPLVLPQVLTDVLARDRGLLPRKLDETYARLRAPGGLLAHLERVLAGTRDFVVEQELAPDDPERDLERRAISVPSGRRDLWLKTGRLSLHSDDASLRLRASFGAEGDDDENPDPEGHELVAALGTLALPGMRAVTRAEEPRATLERLLDGPVLFTQPIGYWNAPQGGARMHHDAFGAPGTGLEADPSGQCGVAYVQLSGRSVWLALSLADLVERTIEFLGWLREGEAPWIAEESLGGHEGLSELLSLAADRRALAAELVRPGCGRLGPLVERGSEFSGALIDAGHACVLRPGDVILLPNHGPDRTAMHAVFSASEGAGYGLSLALRRAQRTDSDSRDNSASAGG